MEKVMNYDIFKVAVVGVALSALLVVGALVSVSGTYNQCVSLEEGLKAQYEQNKNSYDSMFKKIMESAGVTKRYAQDMKDLYAATMEGRKGSGEELFRAIQEANPSMDASLYVQVQRVIESGRNDFASNQKSLLDRKRAYSTYLRTFPTAVIVQVLGFPKIDMDKFGIVTSERTQEAFQSKVDTPINAFE